jgi:hypothetical protein
LGTGDFTDPYLQLNTLQLDICQFVLTTQEVDYGNEALSSELEQGLMCPSLLNWHHLPE